MGKKSKEGDLLGGGWVGSFYGPTLCLFFVAEEVVLWVAGHFASSAAIDLILNGENRGPEDRWPDIIENGS